MRILLVSEPGVDGVFRHVEALARFLIGRSHQVHLAYSDVRGSDRLPLLVKSVADAGGQALNLAVANGPQSGDLAALLKLRRFIAAMKPDVIHAHSSKAGALVRFLSLLGERTPKFYTPHAYYGLSGGKGAKGFVFNTVERLLGRIGTTINLSEGEAEFATRSLGIPRERIRLIPNPVDTARFKPADAEEKRRLRLALGVPEDALLLGSVGRLAFQKDPVTLYRAFAIAAKRLPSLRLCHLGDGELSGECERLAAELGIADRIIRLKYLSEPVSFYQAIDGMILVSRYEGLSFAVLEALACDLPVILSEVPGNLDFIRMGLSHCEPAPKENPEKIAEAMVRWSDKRQAGLPSNHRALAEERFSQEACFGAIVREYENAAGLAANP